MARSLGAYETKGSVVVRGETFEYTFDKKNGLMSGLEVLGEYFPSGPIPDLYVSPDRDPDLLSYAAEYETHASCVVSSKEDHCIEVHSRGSYYSQMDVPFPMTYRIVFQICEDGVVFITVRNEAAEASTIRWLCCCKGTLEAELCPYVCRLSEHSAGHDAAGYTFERVCDAAGEDGRIFGGHFIPWFWFGNDYTGMEVCMWDIGSSSFGELECQGKMAKASEEIGGYFSASKTDNGVMWEILPIRNTPTPLHAGWVREDRFALAITPSKRCDAAYSDLRMHWEEPHSFDPSYVYPSEEQIKTLAQRGTNLFVGGANWLSGEYVPKNDVETRRVIETCHRYGLKIIPSVTLRALHKETAVLPKGAEKLRAKPGVAPGEPGSMRCPGSEGWLAYWRMQVDRMMDEYDFDGMYCDFRHAKLVCENRAHGCGPKRERMMFPWFRDMFGFAREKIKTKCEDGILIGNTNVQPMAMISGLVDARMVRETRDLKKIDEMEANAFYNSHRLGIHSLMCPKRKEQIDEGLIRFWLQYMAPFPLSDDCSEEEIASVRRCWDVLRFFGIGKATWYPSFGSYLAASSDRKEVRVHVHESARRLLLTVINTADEDVEAEISIALSRVWIKPKKLYLIYDPLSKSLLGERLWSGNDLTKLPVRVLGGGFHFLFVQEAEVYPTLVFAGGTDGVRRQHWDQERWVLNLRLVLPCEGPVSIAAHSLLGRPQAVEFGGDPVDFAWNEKQRLVFAQGWLAEEPRVRILYES
ncbi:MAG: hypothetical protein V1800_05195 [Candidatus Latescibacterota bacterium]